MIRQVGKSFIKISGGKKKGNDEMAKDVLLEYVMKVSAVAGTPPASLAYLRKVLCVVPPKAEVTENKISTCTSRAEVEALTDAKCWALFNGGLSNIFVLPASSLALSAVIDAATEKFFTVIIDTSFDNTAIGSLDLGGFDGVVAWGSAAQAEARAFTVQKNNVGFFDLSANAGENLYFAFGKLLSAASWRNQQYIEMPKGSEIDTLGEAELLFEDALSFVLTSEQYGNRLGLFASNQRAIVAPYIYEEIRIRLQSAALNYIALNQPNYTTAEAALLEDVLNSVIGEYVENGTIESGSVKVSTSAEQFILNAEIRVAEPKALWRIKADMYQGSV